VPTYFPFVGSYIISEGGQSTIITNKIRHDIKDVINLAHTLKKQPADCFISSQNAKYLAVAVRA
jgi:hypothetical protein